MRLTLTTFLTIDGVMQGPGGTEEDRRGGFDLGGWLVPYADADMDRFVTEWFSQADGFLLGRKTYEIFAAHWPNVTDPDNVLAATLNDLPKYVVSNTLGHAGWNNSTVVNGDLRSSVEELKMRPGRELQIHGSGLLARALHDLRLIDEYRLWIFPVVLGTGQHLFGDGSIPSAFELIDTKVTSGGVVVHSFSCGGAPSFGSFAIDNGVETSLRH
jgi:dihydrofolate reductase